MLQNEEEEEEQEMLRASLAQQQPASRPTSISTNSNNNKVLTNNSHSPLVPGGGGSGMNSHQAHTDTPMTNNAPSPNNSWNQQYDSWGDGEFEPVDELTSSMLIQK